MYSKISKLALVIGLTVVSTSSFASYKYQIDDDNSITFGGYIKVDARFVDGNVAYQDHWAGNGKGLDNNASQFKIFANETRFNTKYQHGDVTGFIEMDLYGGDQGNQIVSNSYNPRVRHAYISYKNILAGQTWTTFMNPSAIAETADFGSTLMGISFVRQGQVRYTLGGLQLSLENPESFGGDTANDNLPDAIAKYTFKGDWGNISVSALGRQLNTLDDKTETTFGGGFAGKINTFGKDDVRFQFHAGQLGRYVGTAAIKDLVGDKANGYDAEKSVAYNIAYRHFWTNTMRSTVLYGHVKGDKSNVEVSQWGVNIFENLTPELAIGFEVGDYDLEYKDKDSFYGQFSMRYAI